MPLTVQVPDGFLSAEAEQQVITELTNSILTINGTANNPMARRHLIASVLTLPANKFYADAKHEPFINVALRVPTFSLNTIEKRQAFVTAMTDIIERATEGKLSRDRIYVNMVYGDGFWGVGGTAYSDADLIAALDIPI